MFLSLMRIEDLLIPAPALFRMSLKTCSQNERLTRSGARQKSLVKLKNCEYLMIATVAPPAFLRAGLLGDSVEEEDATPATTRLSPGGGRAEIVVVVGAGVLLPAAAKLLEQPTAAALGADCFLAA